MNKDKIDLIKKDCVEIVNGQVDVLLPLKNSKLLITGGTGFVGTWLSEMLIFLNDNYDFNIKIILLSKNALNFSSKAEHIALRKDIVLLEKDVVNVVELDPEISFIIHAAASPDNRQHSSDPLRVMSAITNGTEAVLSAASRLTNLNKFLNISSGLIYGPQPYNLEKISETYQGCTDCDSTISVYPEAKRFAETLCAAFRNQFKLPIVTVRPFAFVGPYQLLDKPWAINNFIYDGLRGGPIRILGNENTVRSYMYASDMVYWLLSVLVKGKIGSAYNIGSPHGITLKSLAEKISDKFPKKIKIISEMPPNKNADKSKFVPDVSLAENTLGLKLTVNLDEALRRTILWHSSV